MDTSEILKAAKEALKAGNLDRTIELMKSVSTQLPGYFEKCPGCKTEVFTLAKSEQNMAECTKCGAMWGLKKVMIKSEYTGDTMNKSEVIAKLWEMYRIGDKDVNAYDINYYDATNLIRKSLLEKLGIAPGADSLVKSEIKKSETTWGGLTKAQIMNTMFTMFKANEEPQYITRLSITKFEHANEIMNETLSVVLKKNGKDPSELNKSGMDRALEDQDKTVDLHALVFNNDSNGSDEKEMQAAPGVEKAAKCAHDVKKGDTCEKCMDVKKGVLNLNDLTKALEELSKAKVETMAFMGGTGTINAAEVKHELRAQRKMVSGQANRKANGRQTAEATKGIKPKLPQGKSAQDLANSPIEKSGDKIAASMAPKRKPSKDTDLMKETNTPPKPSAREEAHFKIEQKNAKKRQAEDKVEKALSLAPKAPTAPKTPAIAAPKAAAVKTPKTPGIAKAQSAIKPPSVPGNDAIAHEQSNANPAHKIGGTPKPAVHTEKMKALHAALGIAPNGKKVMGKSETIKECFSVMDTLRKSTNPKDQEKFAFLAHQVTVIEMTPEAEWPKE